MADAGRDYGNTYTVYVVPDTQPPLFLSGPFRLDMAVAGAVPLFSFTSHEPPLRPVERGCKCRD
jgi:hypothetical protein